MAITETRERLLMALESGLDDLGLYTSKPVAERYEDAAYLLEAVEAALMESGIALESEAQ